ncbi:unnamed protein product, partial [Polarella glacialis]
MVPASESEAITPALPLHMLPSRREVRTASGSSRRRGASGRGRATRPDDLALGETSSARSANSSWGSSVCTAGQRTGTRLGPRQGEALDFGVPLRGGQQPQVALAGLRQFVSDRFGGVKQAFHRMDFHKDGRVSCLEFQEVLSGQEHYCSLQEARELFCLLARGTS